MPRPGVGGGPLAAVAEQERRDSLRQIASLKARQQGMGAMPSEEQIQAVLDEMMGGDDGV
jgi:hypothetical protein